MQQRVNTANPKTASLVSHRKASTNTNGSSGKEAVVIMQPAELSGFEQKQWQSLPHSGYGLYR